MPVEIRNCRTCDRQIRSAEPMCEYCIDAFPVAYESMTRPVGVRSGNGGTAQRAIDIVMAQVFGDDPFTPTGGLQRSS